MSLAPNSVDHDDRMDRPPAGAVAAFLIASFFAWVLSGLGVPLPAFDVRRGLQIVLLCAMVVWIVSYGPARGAVAEELSRFPRATRRGLLVVAVLGSASSALAAIPLVGFREVALYVLLFFLGLAVAASRRRTGEAFGEALTDAIVIVSIAYLATYLVGATALGTAMSLPGFEHPRMFNHVQVLLLPLLATTAIQPRWKPWQRALLLTVLAGWWYLLFVSGGRAAFVAIILGAASAAFVVGRRWRRWLVTYALAGVAGAVAYGVTLFGSAAQVTTYGVQNALERGITTTGRGLLWALAVEYVKEQPLLGIGPGHYAHAPRAAPNGTGPHNIPLQFAAEWGLLVALVLATLATWGLWRWLAAQRAASVDPAMRAALTAALVGAGIDALFADSLQAPLAGTVVAIVAGVAYGAYDVRGTTDHPRTRRWALRAGLSSSAAVLVATAVLTYHAPAEETGDILRPRFWLNGVVPAVDGEP